MHWGRFDLLVGVQTLQREVTRKSIIASHPKLEVMTLVNFKRKTEKEANQKLPVKSLIAWRCWLNKSHNKSVLPIGSAGERLKNSHPCSRAILHRHCIGKCIQSIQTGWDDYGRPLVLTIPRRRSHKSGELWDGKLPARDSSARRAQSFAH